LGRVFYCIQLKGELMGSYPIEIRRCQHIKTSGAQCGSPALRSDKFCYYHKQNRTVPAELYMDGERYCDSQIMLPPFEDGHSIQMVLRHVVQLMLQKRIERKDAGLVLYALQIASGNLKQMRAEKPRPTQVVVDPERVEETPMGMTPWSATGQGHDPEEETPMPGHDAAPEFEGGDDVGADEAGDRKRNCKWASDLAAEIQGTLIARPEVQPTELKEMMWNVHEELRNRATER
jgi:hypothetical protein